MARKTSANHREIEKAKQLRDQATTVREYRKALSVILFAEYGLNADQTAGLLGTSRRTVFRDLRNICSQDGISKKAWGGRRHSAMTIEEEREFLSRWQEQATSGGVLTVPPIHAALVERVGHAIPLSTTYRLLARHGWRKIQPDTKHPKSEPDVQFEFKKNSRKQWLPPA